MRDKEPADIIFGEVLRDVRKASRKTQEELALDSGLERTFISMLELGQRRPTTKTLIQLSRGLELPLSELIELFEIQYKEKTGHELHIV